MSENSCKLKSIYTQVISLLMVVVLVAEDNLVGEKKVLIDLQLCEIFRIVTNYKKC